MSQRRVHSSVRAAAVIGLGLTLALLSACNQPRVREVRTGRYLGQPILNNQGRPRSLALASPVVRRQRRYYAQRGEEPWYHDRLDHRPGLTVGTKSPTYRSALTITTDDLHTTPRGNVHDHFDRTTRRTRRTRTIE